MVQRHISVTRQARPVLASNPRQLFSAKWEVRQDGYRWADAIVLPKRDYEREEQARLSATPYAHADEWAFFARPPVNPEEDFPDSRGIERVLVLARTRTTRKYDPLNAEPALYHTFAETPQTQTGVAAFADDYGLLGGPVRRPVSLVKDDPDAQLVKEGEPLSLWVEEIRAMADAIDARRLANTSSRRKAERRAKRITRRGEKIEFRLQSGNIVTLNGLEEAGDADDVDITIAALNALLAHRLAGQLGVAPSQVPFGQWSMANQASVAFQLEPTSLLAALWLQFFFTLTTEQEERQCKQCGNWFAVGVNVTGRKSRRDRQFCSNACKTADSRARRLKQVEGARSRASKPTRTSQQYGVTKQRQEKWSRA